MLRPYLRLPCADRGHHYFLVSIRFSAASPNPHPAVHFSPAGSFITQPPSILRYLRPLSPPRRCLARISRRLCSFLPQYQLLAALFLIMSTLRLQLAALHFSTSLLLKARLSNLSFWLDEMEATWSASEGKWTGGRVLMTGAKVEIMEM